jgi:hypothetical protein
MIVVDMDNVVKMPNVIVINYILLMTVVKKCVQIIVIKEEFVIIKQVKKIHIYF